MCFQSCFATTKCQEGCISNHFLIKFNNWYLFNADFSEFLSFQNSSSPGKKVSKSRYPWAYADFFQRESKHIICLKNAWKHTIFFQKSRKTYYFGRPRGRGASAPSCPPLGTPMPVTGPVSVVEKHWDKRRLLLLTATNVGFIFICLVKMLRDANLNWKREREIER